MNTPRWNIDLLSELSVYEPAEDTFLLLDALEADLENIIASKPQVVLEIGCGSGVVIAAIASVVKNCHYIAVDINPKACKVMRNTAEMNEISVDIVTADLLKNFKLNGAIDMIVFNPPYVETEDEETLASGISQSWAGGAKGRKILDELLPDLNTALSQNGTFYLVAISYNDIEELEKRMKHYGFNCCVLARRQIPGELLYILKFSKFLNNIFESFSNSIARMFIDLIRSKASSLPKQSNHMKRTV